MLHDWVIQSYAYAISALAISFVIADLSLSIYVAWNKKRRPDLQPLAEVMGFGGVQQIRRFAFVHSRAASRITDELARFWIGVLRFTTVPGALGVISFFVMGVAGVR